MWYKINKIKRKVNKMLKITKFNYHKMNTIGVRYRPQMKNKKKMGIKNSKYKIKGSLVDIISLQYI